MKVAFVNYPSGPFVPPPATGSLEIWVHEVARRLARSCQVVVYSLRGALPKEQWCEGVQYRRISKPDRTAAAIRWLHKVRGGWRIAERLRDFRSVWYNCGYSVGIAADLRTHPCDIVHIMNLSQYAPIIRLLNRKAKIVIHMQCEWLTRLHQATIARRLKGVDLILGCSDYVTDKVRLNFPQFAHRCQTLYNGVDVETFSPNGGPVSVNHGRTVVLWVGRISPEKGIHTLITAFSEVARRCPRAQLEIVGPVAELSLETLLTCDDPANILPLSKFYDGKGYLSHLRQQVLSLGLADHVTFTGPVPHRDLVRRYQGADVFVFPSVCNELFGMPIVEAMSAGTPAVATQAGGMPELIENGRSGLLVPRDDSAALAEAIMRLLADENLRRSMGRAARQRALECFSWESIAEALMGHYNEICYG